MAANKKVKELTSEEFESVIGDGITLVDFWAEWCYPCRMQGPILDKVADRIGEKARVCKVNVDENREVAIQQGITGIPALFIFKDGEKVREFVGLQPEGALVSALESFAA